MNCTTTRIFQYLIIEKIANKSLSNIEMENNSLSCSRISAWLVVHQIAELQLTAPLQNTATTKFYNQAPIFRDISSRLVSGSTGRYFVLVQQWRSPCKYTIVVMCIATINKKLRRRCAVTLNLGNIFFVYKLC